MATQTAGFKRARAPPTWPPAHAYEGDLGTTEAAAHATFAPDAPRLLVRTRLHHALADPLWPRH